MNLKTSNNSSKALLAVSSLALMRTAQATVDFINQENTLQGRIDSWLLDDHYFNAIRPCGDYYQLLDGWHWKDEALQKMVRVPGISTQVGLAGADSATMQCVQRAMQKVEARDDKIFYGVVWGVVGTVGAASLGTYIVRSGVASRARSAIGNAACQATGVLSQAAHAVSQGIRAVGQATNTVLRRAPALTPEDFELADADAMFEADIEANLLRPAAVTSHPEVQQER